MIEENNQKVRGLNKQIIIIVLFLVFILGGLFAIKNFIAKDKIEDFNYFHMKLQSDVFKNGGYIPSKYTCDGLNVNPSLQITEAPTGTKSLVLIVTDLDALSGEFVYWLVWNIKPGVEFIEENNLPIGAVEGKTDFDKNKYGGPCPPSGTHRYKFELYAVDFVFDAMSENTDKQKILELIKGRILAKVGLVGLYRR